MVDVGLGHLSQVELGIVRPEHIGELYRWSVQPSGSFRWRFGGATPSPEQFAAALWSNVLCQFVAVERTARQPHGLVVCYNANHQDGIAYFAVLGNPDRPTGGGAMVGLLKLLDHVFSNWAFRKLYAEIPEFNLDEFGGSLRRHLIVEGRLVEHIFHGNRYWDQIIVSLSREEWLTSLRPRFAKLLNDEPDLTPRQPHVGAA